MNERPLPQSTLVLTREPQPAINERLLSIPEFAARLGGISPATVHTWLCIGRFGLERTKVGRRTMLRESELLKVINVSAKPRSCARNEQQQTA